MKSQLSGKVTITELVFTMIFFAAIFHVTAFVLGVPIDVEVFDTLR